MSVDFCRRLVGKILRNVVTVIALKYALLVSQLSFGYAPANGSWTVAKIAAATRDVRTADPSADGRRSAAIFATVELSSAGAYRLAAPRAIPC